jgi:hypothetical protein
MRHNFLHSAAGLLFIILAFLLLGALPGCRFSSNTAGSVEVNSNVSNGSANSVARKNDLFTDEATGSGGFSNTQSNTTTMSEEGSTTSSVQNVLPISWSFSPGQYRGKNGQRYTFKCLPNGETANVLGTDIYTDDSSVCTAAVHEGLISIASGGTVTIEIRPGQDAYIGSERNGIKSGDFNYRWTGSFVFVRDTGAGS